MHCGEKERRGVLSACFVPLYTLVLISRLVYTGRMRTNVNLDDDVHQIASIYAASKGISLGAAIGELIRKAEASPKPAPDIRHSPNGLPCFPPTGKPLTLEMVKEAESEID